ncbi:uncharacterized protein LDX57_007633 [Aspergillus melleus]|uniref:uncharacterized protein n=1 Tax=Aspergillus melleus TaxID=138277 RepID=UPI001E8EE074|nr:uncharacterized protein LDX57_007633 [Aspergillus melleus]KAH8429961.1 hypothetical protein LDX57_007633 [Aspergillus melleus]
MGDPSVVKAIESKASVNHIEDGLQARHNEDHMTLAYMFIHHKTLIFWSFYWAMCPVGWGFDAQIKGAMIAVESFRRDFGYVLDGEAILPADWQSAFNVASSIGQFFGGFFCSWLAERIGRKSSLVVGLCLCTGGTFGEVFAGVRVAFLVSKLILGVGLGFFLTLGPLMCSEITPVILRGPSTAGINLGICIGQLLSNSVVKGFSHRTDRWAYAGPFAVQLFFTCFLLAGLPFAPESPWYLIRKGRMDQARKGLEKLWGKGTDAHMMLSGIEHSIEESSHQANTRYTDCFKGTNFLRTCISCGGFVCQHLVGIIFVLGYSTYLFELAGLEPSHSFDLGLGSPRAVCLATS